MKPRSSAIPVQTHYSVLKVSRDAPIEVIRAAYRSLSSKHHPDHNPDAAGASEVMAAINAAYAVLSDPLKRQDHDIWILREESPVDERASEKPVPRPSATGTRLVPVRKQPLTLGSVQYRPYWRGLSAMAVVAASAYALVLFFDDHRDFWLERAWQQTWRGEVSPNPASPVVPLSAQPYTAEAPAAASFGKALNWETALKR